MGRARRSLNLLEEGNGTALGTLYLNRKNWKDSEKKGAKKKRIKKGAGKRTFRNNRKRRTKTNDL